MSGGALTSSSFSFETFELWAVRIALLLFAAALQVQLTLFSDADYQGLRVSAADLLIPAAGVFILISLLLKRSCWPRWEKPFGYWAIILLSAVIALGLANGYRIHGDISNWALLNKGAGWCVLMAYIAAGAWFGTNRPQDMRRWFVLPFVIFLCLVTVADGTLRIILYDLNARVSFVLLGHDFGYNLAGFMVNRNAFAFLYLSALSLSSILLIHCSSLSKIERLILKTPWLILPMFLILNLSRASVLILAPLMIYLLIAHFKFFIRRILPLLFIGLLVAPFVDFTRASHVSEKITKIQKSVDEKQPEALGRGDTLRFQILKDGFFMLKEHPLTGIGIGSAFKSQTEQNWKYVSVIDSTPLWILTEMGPFGLLSFLVAYVVMLRTLYRKSQDSGDYASVFSYAVMFMLIAFGLFSLLHEILYSRFLWFFLGLALVSPALSKRQSE